MIKRVMRILSLMFVFTLLIGGRASAYSEIPDYFDFGETVFKMDAGTTKDVWVRSYYNYTYYMGPHSSKGTYMECASRSGTEYVKIHIGADETEKNVFFYFYVTDDRVGTEELHDCIEVYVQNMDPAAVAIAEQQKAAEAAAKADANAQKAAVEALRTYSGNTADFNAYFYYNNYKDLRDAFGTDGAKLLEHYKTFGINEHRVANRKL